MCQKNVCAALHVQSFLSRLLDSFVRRYICPTSLVSPHHSNNKNTKSDVFAKTASSSRPRPYFEISLSSDPTIQRTGDIKSRSWKDPAWQH